MPMKDFHLTKKQKKEANSPKIQVCEELMWKFQQALPWVQSGENGC